LSRRDTEEVGVEVLNIVEDTGRERVALTGCRTVAVKVVVRSPAIGADLTYYVTAVPENFPELPRSVGSRKATCHAHNGDTVCVWQFAGPSPAHLPDALASGFLQILRSMSTRSSACSRC